MIRSDYGRRDAGMPVIPGPLHATSAFPFVGRSAELGRLRALMPDGEGGGAVLLGGDSGAGKTRLVREFAAEVADDGGLVLYGACDAVVRTPYGPFVEALHQLDPSELQAAGGELTRLLPGVAAPAPAEADPDTERHRLHTAVADLLGAITRPRPA